MSKVKNKQNERRQFFKQQAQLANRPASEASRINKQKSKLIKANNQTTTTNDKNILL